MPGDSGASSDHQLPALHAHPARTHDAASELADDASVEAWTRYEDENWALESDRPSRGRSAFLSYSLPLLGVLLVGAVDFSSGVEVRVQPLYFLPLALGAWRWTRRATGALAMLCAMSWMLSNHLAGLRFSHEFFWWLNFAMQAVAFATVGFLVSALRVSLAREREVSRTDALTNLRNARWFYEQAALALALARRYRHATTIAYLDLDGLKRINDQLGHRRGDSVLKLAGEVIKRTLRTTDLAARVGGDEFVLLLPETGQSSATRSLERLRDQLRKAMAESGLSVTASIGAVVLDTHTSSLADALDQADALMYRAKLTGKDRLFVEPATVTAAPTLPEQRRRPSSVARSEPVR